MIVRCSWASDRSIDQEVVLIRRMVAARIVSSDAERELLLYSAGVLSSDNTGGSFPINFLPLDLLCPLTTPVVVVFVVVFVVVGAGRTLVSRQPRSSERKMPNRQKLPSRAESKLSDP